MFTPTFVAQTQRLAAVFLALGLLYFGIPQNVHAFSASVVVSNDVSSPAFSFVPAGANDVTANIFKMRASGDSVALKMLALKLSQGSSVDVSKLLIYANGIKVAEAVFAGATSTAVINFANPVTLQRDANTVFTVKADLSPIGNGQAVTQSGHLIAIDYASAFGTSNTNGSAASFTGSTSVAGFRAVKSFPTVALMPLASTTVQDGRLMRFAISADSHGPVGIAQLAFSINQYPLNSLSSASLYEFLDPNYSVPANTAQGLLGAFVVYGSGGVNRIAINGVEIPAGQTRYFELRASVAASASSVTTTLLGDAGYMGISAYNPQTWGSAMAWSPNSTTTASIFDVDWLNAFAVPGLPANGISFTRAGIVAPQPACALSAASLNKFGKYALSWTTTNATDLSIESTDAIFGSVSPVSAGSMTVFVSESGAITGTVTGPGGTAYCSVFVSGPNNKLPLSRGITP